MSTDSKSQTSIILVSGAWHTDFHIQPAIAPLTKLGYRVVPCALPSAGVKEPQNVFEDDVSKIYNAIEAETKAGNQVCVIAHSAGGLPSTFAASRFLEKNSDDAAMKSKLVRFCFLASFLNAPRALEGSDWFGIDEESGYFTASRTEEVFYNDMSLSASKPFVDALVLQSPAARPEPTATLWKEIPGTYILCLQDKSIPEAKQRLEAGDNNMDIVEIDTAHCPFISQPDVFAGAVHGILSR